MPFCFPCQEEGAAGLRGKAWGEQDTFRHPCRLPLAQLCPAALGCPGEFSVTLGPYSSCWPGEQQVEQLWPSEQLLEASSTGDAECRGEDSMVVAPGAAAMSRGTEPRENVSPVRSVQAAPGCPGLAAQAAVAALLTPSLGLLGFHCLDSLRDQLSFKLRFSSCCYLHGWRGLGQERFCRGQRDKGSASAG